MRLGLLGDRPRWRRVDDLSFSEDNVGAIEDVPTDILSERHLATNHHRTVLCRCRGICRWEPSPLLGIVDTSTWGAETSSSSKRMWSGEVLETIVARRIEYASKESDARLL